MTGWEEFLRERGLWAVFLLSAFQGDLTLLLSGMLVRLGVWPPVQVWLLGAAGAFSADTIYFSLGHAAAHGWLKTSLGQRVMPTIERFAARYGLWSLLVSRYVYGTRAAMFFFWGFHRLKYRTFLLLDGINCLAWAALFGGLGYIFATSMVALVGTLSDIGIWLLIGLAAFLLLLALKHYLAERVGAAEEDE